MARLPRGDAARLLPPARLPAAKAENEGGSGEAFVADDGRHRLFAPLIVRPIDLNGAAGGGLCDATSPYGYPSPLLVGGRSQEESHGLSWTAPWSRCWRPCRQRASSACT